MILAGLVLANGLALAQDRFDPGSRAGGSVEAIAVGDFDCSGAPGMAALWTNDQGDLLIELTLRVPERYLPAPASPREGSTIEFDDADQDGCDDLIITHRDGESYVVNPLQHRGLLAAAEEIAGDLEPDMHIQLRKPLRLPGDLTIGLNATMCDWDNYCYDEGCAEPCSHWGVTASYQCGFNEDGTPKWCQTWGCTHYKMHCVLP